MRMYVLTLGPFPIAVLNHCIVRHLPWQALPARRVVLHIEIVMNDKHVSTAAVDYDQCRPGCRAVSRVGNP